MRSTRAKYHYILRNVRCNEKQLRKTETVDHILRNEQSGFWDKVSKLTKCPTKVPNIVDGLEGKQNISGLFANKYEKLFNSVSTTQSELDILKQKLNNKINSSLKCLMLLISRRL